MAREFTIPEFYRSPIISRLKKARQLSDARKKDRSPTLLEIGDLTFKIARHFGLCFGVENAIEIAYRALTENPQKRVFLLSEMIHNPHVNEDLVQRGVRFLLDTAGNQIIPFEELNADDIVIVPAFGTTLELFQKLEEQGIDPQLYNTTCPFVEKVWKRASSLGERGYTIIIHGKHNHEETRATFSHSRISAPSLVVRDREEAQILCDYILGNHRADLLLSQFDNRYSENFDPESDLKRIGVVNQTTMLATETQEISAMLKSAMIERYGTEDLAMHFADTRDTLCYATSENQSATYGLIESGGDVAIVVGGYNSSNTSHLVELCEEHCPTYYVKDAGEILNKDNIRHLNLSTMSVVETKNWLPEMSPVTVLITAGASCPDALVDQVISRVAELYGVSQDIPLALERMEQKLNMSDASSSNSAHIEYEKLVTIRS